MTIQWSLTPSIPLLNLSLDLTKLLNLSHQLNIMEHTLKALQICISTMPHNISYSNLLDPLHTKKKNMNSTIDSIRSNYCLKKTQIRLNIQKEKSHNIQKPNFSSIRPSRIHIFLTNKNKHYNINRVTTLKSTNPA